MTIGVNGTSPMKIDTFDKSKIEQKPMMDHIEIIKSDKVFKEVDDLLSTEAGHTALKMSDMEVDGKQCISAKKWNAYVAENFPHVAAKPVNNYIELIDAMHSLTTYTVQEQAAQKSEEKAVLETKSQTEGGNGKAPEMGV